MEKIREFVIMAIVSRVLHRVNCTQVLFSNIQALGSFDGNMACKMKIAGSWIQKITVEFR